MSQTNVSARAKAGTALISLGAALAVVAAVLLVPVGAARAGTAYTVTVPLKSAHVGATNPGFQTEDFSDAYANLSVPAAPNNWGWHFIAPQGEFDSLTVTFANAGTIGPITPNAGNSHPGPQAFLCLHGYR